MTGAAPVGETGPTPTDIPAEASEFTGEGTGGAYVPSPASVAIGYLHSTRVSHSWTQSMMTMVAYDKSIGLNLIGTMPYAVSCNGPNSLVEGRNLVVENFLDRSGAEWLFFVDTDMGFEGDALERLLLAADPVTRPVVGGLCFAMKHMQPDGMGGFHVLPVPTLFMFARNDNQGVGFANRFIYPPETMVQVAGTGAAFLLIHRSVLEAMREKYGNRWFNFVQYEDGATVSEDLSFCWRLAELQIPVFVHTGVKVTHHKELWLSEADYHMPDREPMARQMADVRAVNPTEEPTAEDPWCECGLAKTIKPGGFHRSHCSKYRGVKNDGTD